MILLNLILILIHPDFILRDKAAVEVKIDGLLVNIANYSYLPIILTL